MLTKPSGTHSLSLLIKTKAPCTEPLSCRWNYSKTFWRVGWLSSEPLWYQSVLRCTWMSLHMVRPSLVSQLYSEPSWLQGESLGLQGETLGSTVSLHKFRLNLHKYMVNSQSLKCKHCLICTFAFCRGPVCFCSRKGKHAIFWSVQCNFIHILLIFLIENLQSWSSERPRIGIGIVKRESSGPPLQPPF